MKRPGEGGFTAVELLVALAITSLLASLTGLALRSFLATTRSEGEQLAVLGDQWSSSRWLSRDAQMAPAAGVEIAPGTLRLRWSDAAGGSLHESFYHQAGENLLRTHSYEGLTSTIAVARYLAPAGFSPSLGGRLLTVVITSTQGRTSRSRSELIYLRSQGELNP